MPFASFDLTPDQRELHAFFSPPSPTAAAAAEKSRQEREQEQEQQQRKYPVAAAAAAPSSKSQLSLPKAPPAVLPPPSCDSSRKHVEARAGGWKS